MENWCILCAPVGCKQAFQRDGFRRVVGHFFRAGCPEKYSLSAGWLFFRPLNLGILKILCTQENDR